MLQGSLKQAIICSPLNQRITKRSTGSSCQGLKNSTYTTNGATFDVLCNTVFSYEGYLDVEYTNTFTECVDICATYESTVPCIGIEYESGVGGPTGQNLCYMLWNLTDETGNGTVGTDGARLQLRAVVLSFL
jgi:hypothetical protein